MKKALRRDLITAIADKGWDEQDAEKFIADFITVMRKFMLDGKQVKLTHFGSFTPSFKDSVRKIMFDKEVVTEPKIKIKFVASTSIQGEYAAGTTVGTKASEELKKFRQNLS